MIDVLIVTDTADNIKLVWRHFCTNDYEAASSINNDNAMEMLSKCKKGTVPVFYCGNNTHCFMDFYRKLRAGEKTAEMPLVVLADFKWAKVLSQYVHLKNTMVTSITVNHAKLLEIMRTAARSGFEKKNSPSRPAMRPRR